MDFSHKTNDSVEATPEDPFLRMRAAKRTIHYLREPHNLSSAWLWGNLHYQMQWSVETLENMLLEEGCPHVLQLNAFSCSEGGMSWENPDRWYLYADGICVARGDGDQARKCFEESAETFRDLCRESIERANLTRLERREYWLLCRARDISRFEPYDDGLCVAGRRKGRVQ